MVSRRVSPYSSKIFKPHQRRLAVYMTEASVVLFTTSKQADSIDVLLPKTVFGADSMKVS